MVEPIPVRIVSLENGLILSFYDRTNRYFGDYHRAVVAIEGTVNLDVANFSNEQKGALVALPDALLLRRELERMGVTGEQLNFVVNDMIDSFLTSTKGYLERAGMPEQLLKKRQAENGRRRRRSFGSSL